MVTPIIHRAKQAQTAAIIFLHGLGDSGHGWSEIAEDMQMPWCKFIFPHAPKRPVTINGGARMPAWFDITSLGVGGVDDEAGFKETHKYVTGLIKEELDNGIPSDRIIVGGFSQGGAQSVYSCLHYEHPLAGCVCLSAWVALRDKYPAEISPVNAKIPIFMGHGKQDVVVPFDYGKLSHGLLLKLGLPAVFHEYNMQHSSCPQEMEDLKRFFHERLPNKPIAAAAEQPIPAAEQLAAMSVRDLKDLMAKHGIPSADCIEKGDMIRRLQERS